MASSTHGTQEQATVLLQELVSTTPDVMVVPLTVEEAKQLRTSFMKIADRLEEIGTASFSELFINHPEAIRIFVSNRVFPETLTEVQYSWELKAHSLRVMHTFEKIINRLDKPSTIWSGMISDIGCRHAAYNAKPAYLPVLVAAFRHSFFKEFTRAGILTPELSNIWYKLFNNMTVLMTAAVVASFIDSYAEYKHGGAPPVWVGMNSANAAAAAAAPPPSASANNNHTNNNSSSSTSSLHQNNPPPSPSPPSQPPSACPVMHNNGRARTSLSIESTHNSHPPACPSPSVASSMKGCSHANSCKHPHTSAAQEQSVAGAGGNDLLSAPQQGSRSSSLKKRFTAMLNLPYKSPQKSANNQNNKKSTLSHNNSLSHSSSGEDVQIIHI